MGHMEALNCQLLGRMSLVGFEFGLPTSEPIGSIKLLSIIDFVTHRI